MSRGYNRPPDIPAAIRRGGRAVERVVKQAKSDIEHGARVAKPVVGAAVRRVREGVRKIKRATGR